MLILGISASFYSMFHLLFNLFTHSVSLVNGPSFLCLTIFYLDDILHLIELGVHEIYRILVSAFSRESMRKQ